MKKIVLKQYPAFAADGFKNWGDNTPMVSITASNHHTSTWNTLDLTLEEAQTAIEILQAAIEEAKAIEDHKPWNDFESDSPF